MTRARHPTELLTLSLSVLACLCFVLGLSDLPLRRAPERKAPESIRISEQQRTGSVRVTALRDTGAALAAATVQVFWERAGSFHWIAAESTDNSGQALLSRLPTGRLWLLAEAPGFARASSTLVLGAEPRTLSLALHSAQALAVTVLDENGVALPKATVLVETADPLPFGALTAEQGVARLTRLGPAPWSVKASAPGYESVSRAGVRGPISLTLRRLASLEVAVLDVDGKPAAGATVMIAGATLWPARSALSNASGSARITGLLAGNYDLRASLGSQVAPTLLGFPLARGQNEKLTLRLEPGRTVVAVVTDGDGDHPVAVANADVVLAEAGLSSFPIRGRTGTDGKVSLGPIASGPATLGARAEDFVGSALVSVPEPLLGPVRVPLTRGGAILGEVADARGFPVDGASIEVVGSDSDGLPIAETPALVGFRQNHFAWSLSGPVPLIPAGELGVMPGPVPPIPKPGAASALTTNAAGFATPLSEPAPWVSNRGGHFTARPVTPGRVRVIVRHPDFVEGTSELVAVAPGGEAKVKIVLLRGASLEGRVLDERGQPLSGVEVELSSARASRTESATTASDGTFAFAAVPADLTLSLSRPEDPSRVVLRKSLHLAEGAHDKLELTLPALREPVRVVALDEDARPIELVEIAATSLEPTRPLRLTRFSDAEGAVSFPDAFGENLRIVAEAPGYARLSRSVPAAPRELKLTLRRGVIVEGRVTAVRGRRAVSGAVVSVSQNGVRKVATSDSDGVYRLRDIAPGELHARVEHSDYADEQATLLVESTGRADRPFSLPDIDLFEAGEVEGEVVDQRGERIEGARVSAGDALGYLPAGKNGRGVVISDRDGHFLLPGVHPGNATITAVSSAAGRGSARAVEVSSGRTSRGVRIQLAPQGSESELPPSPGNVAIGLGERGNAPSIEVVVVSVAESSEAERAGVEPGDVINALDGVRPTSMADARARLGGQPGSDVVLELSRASLTLRLRVLREAIRR
ncbi:MAG TPA: carboxypeptidase regulatory-like domain-containing protein [Polyangiaceae bacterium]|nr:carboxypeptidase regulatory-like domain-containing protein [Polyangiaceae bacterium]